MARACVMMGSLSNFTVRQVLDVVGLSRQHTVIELHGRDGARLTSVNLKGGHLVKGDSDQHPREALDAALRAPASCTFQVFRLDDAGSYSSFGRLVELLSGGASRSAVAPVVAEGVGAPSPAAPVGGPVAAAATTPIAAAAPVPSVPAAATPSAPAIPPPIAAPAAAIAPPAVTTTAQDERRPFEVPVARPASSPRPPDTVGVSVAVASPKGGVGKTTITLNTAISLAHRGLSVIVIDGDINGDLLSLINQRGSGEVGTYDVLERPAQLDAALRRTRVHGLRVLPASGRSLPASALRDGDRSEKWRGLIRQAERLADLVLVDCPAGVTHTTAEVLQSVTHVLGVFQAGTVASRSFEMFERSLASLSERQRPTVAGIVVNMLRQDAPSTRAYEGLVAGDSSGKVLGTVITHSEAFEEASAAATPVRLHGTDASRELAWLFDNLASELVSRLPLAQAAAASGAFVL